MKKILFTCIVLCLISYSFFFPEITVNAAKSGIEIWFHQILPSLLPFTIISALLVKSDFLQSFKGNSNLIACILTMSCGFIFGFPIGAKLSADFYKEKLLSKNQAVVLSIATNNFSPIYVCGFALPLLFGSKEYNYETYIFIYIFPLVIITIYLLLNTFFRQDIVLQNTKTSSHFRLNISIMDDSIISSFYTLIKICGYIVLFSIITKIITNLISIYLIDPPYIISLILGNMEITNGINLLSSLPLKPNTKYIFTIQLLSFGGLSGIAQTSSILSNAELSTHKYIIGKAILSLLSTLLSVIYVFFIRLL